MPSGRCYRDYPLLRAGLGGNGDEDPVVDSEGTPCSGGKNGSRRRMCQLSTDGVAELQGTWRDHVAHSAGSAVGLRASTSAASGVSVEVPAVLTGHK